MSSKVYTALGLMSGTSLDGVDAAIIRTDGEKIYGFDFEDIPNSTPPKQPAIMEPYTAHLKAELTYTIEAALKWNFEGPKPNSFSRAEDIITEIHSVIVDSIFWRRILETDNDKPAVDLIGFHGQTVLHKPPENGQAGQTLQLGNGQKIADDYGVPCVYDFRSADVKAGGQGAPLAPIYHKALCDYSGLTGNTLVLNLGGVGNYTWVGNGPLTASDTGPANGPLDSWLNQHGHDYDSDGKYSEAGNIDFELIDTWLERDFFQKSIPKSADRYDFDVLADLASKSLEDGAATLAAFCALSVKHTLSQLRQMPDQIIVCGGGRKNKTIMNMLRAEMACPVKTAEDVGWRGDFIEAEAFAYLAVRSMLGLPISFPETTGAPIPMSGGKIAYPKP